MDQSRYELISRVKKILASLKRRGVIVFWKVDGGFAFFRYAEGERVARISLKAVIRWSKNKTFDRMFYHGSETL